MDDVQAAFCERYSAEQQVLIRQHWDFLIKVAARNQKKRRLDGWALFNELCHTVDQVLVDNVSLYEDSVSDATKDRLGLIFGDVTDPAAIKISDLIFTMFVDADAEKQAQMRAEVQGLLLHLHEQLATMPDSTYASLDMIISCVLAKLGYLQPDEGEILRIPQRVLGSWTLEPYRVQRIELSEGTFGPPYTVYGLIPQDKQAAPFLICTGTTFGVKRGAGLTVLADMPLARYSVGESIFTHSRQQQLEIWFKSLSDYPKVKVCGHSLGGAMTQLICMRFAKYVQSGVADSTPGLAAATVRRYEKYVADVSLIPHVDIVLNAGDLVTMPGKYYAPQACIYLYLPAKSFSTLYKHWKLFALQDSVIRLRLQTHAKPRSVMGKIHDVLSPLLLVLTVPVVLIERLLSRLWRPFRHRS